MEELCKHHSIFCAFPVEAHALVIIEKKIRVPREWEVFRKQAKHKQCVAASYSCKCRMTTWLITKIWWDGQPCVEVTDQDRLPSLLESRSMQSAFIHRPSNPSARVARALNRRYNQQARVAAWRESEHVNRVVEGKLSILLCFAPEIQRLRCNMSTAIKQWFYPFKTEKLQDINLLYCSKIYPLFFPQKLKLSTDIPRD